MGEMLLEQKREDLPVVIIRPTMVTSTYQDPFPGWIEGARYAQHVKILVICMCQCYIYLVKLITAVELLQHIYIQYGHRHNRK
jgi:hypothetical protein